MEATTKISSKEKVRVGEGFSLSMSPKLTAKLTESPLTGHPIYERLSTSPFSPVELAHGCPYTEVAKNKQTGEALSIKVNMFWSMRLGISPPLV